jgi:methionine sulfoxide reductase heme-binding subunit
LTAAAPSPLWFLDRSAGELTLLLLTTVVVLGILRAALPTTSPVVVEGLHINLALLAIAFGGAHVLAAVLDPFAHLGPVDALVPFASAYRTTWLGLGVVSAYLYGIALFTSWPARRLPRQVWVWLHRVMYLGWVLAFVHSLATGSDTRNELFLIVDLLAVLAVLIAFLAFRVAEGWSKSSLPSLWAGLAGLAVLVVLGIAVWAVNGPLQPGWAHASGTPPDLLSSGQK